MAKKGLVDECADVTPLFDLPRAGDVISHAEWCLNYFKAREDKEGMTLEQYMRALDEINSPAIRFMLQILCLR